MVISVTCGFERTKKFGIVWYSLLYQISFGTGSARLVGYRQSMLQHAKDLEGFAPQTHDQGNTLDGISLRRFETQVSKLPALAGRQEQTVVCSMPRGFGCCEVINPNLLLILPSVGTANLD